MIFHGKMVAWRRRAIVACTAVVVPLMSRVLLQADEPSPQTTDNHRSASELEPALDGKSWRRTMDALDEWFSTQTIYDPRQVGDIKKQIAEEVSEMPDDDRDAFQQDLDAKLKMVFSPEGRDILEWVATNLAAAAPEYRKKMDLKYPDLLKLTAAQLREQLDLLERRRSSARTQTVALERARHARIAALQEEQRQRYDAQQRARDHAAASFNSGSPYHPGGMSKHTYTPVRPVYGWGFGFW